MPSKPLPAQEVALEILPPAKPWEQRPQEPDSWYARFLIYRNLGLDRTLAKAQSATGGERRRKEAGSWDRMAAQWAWVERADAWDKHLAQAEGDAIADEIAKGNLATARAYRRLAEMVDAATEKNDMETLRKVGPVLTVLMGKGMAFTNCVKAMEIFTKSKETDVGNKTIILNFPDA